MVKYQHSKIDLKQLEMELRNMHRWNPIYKIVKKVGLEFGWWKTPHKNKIDS